MKEKAIFAHESGTVRRQTIVFLNGNGANGTMWNKHMSQLSDYHCLAQDFPGFGQSGDQEWISLRATTDEIIKLVQTRTLKKRVKIFGLSLGGSLAMT